MTDKKTESKEVAVKGETALVDSPFMSPDDVGEEFTSEGGFSEIKVNQGSDTFTVNGQETKKVQGFIISIQKRRAFYSKAYTGEAVEPDCSSRGCVEPEADANDKQNFDCESCPQNEWGTSSTGKGKACAEKRLLHLLVNGSDEVYELVVSTASLMNVNSFAFTIASSGKYYQYTAVEMTVEPKTKVYSVINFKLGDYVVDNKDIKALINKAFTENKDAMEERF